MATKHLADLVSVGSTASTGDQTESHCRLPPRAATRLRLGPRVAHTVLSAFFVTHFPKLDAARHVFFSGTSAPAALYSPRPTRASQLSGFRAVVMSSITGLTHPNAVREQSS